MLFDLRSRGRRRTVQAVYLFLASIAMLKIADRRAAARAAAEAQTPFGDGLDPTT